jgi:hypothetical protein
MNIMFREQKKSIDFRTHLKKNNALYIYIIHKVLFYRLVEIYALYIYAFKSNTLKQNKARRVFDSRAYRAKHYIYIL